MSEIGNVYNPNNKPVEELPSIFAYSIPSGFGRDVFVYALAEDGEGLGNHMSSHDSWGKLDIGFAGDTRPDRHKTYQAHYPDGYKMEWTTIDDDRLKTAIKINHEKYPQDNDDVTESA
jgi:hypothetical protein